MAVLSFNKALKFKGWNTYKNASELCWFNHLIS